MNKGFFLVLCCIALVISFSQQELKPQLQYLQELKEAERLFSQAETLSSRNNYSEAEEEKLYLSSLAVFEKLTREKSPDSIKFIAAGKAGIIHYYFDSLEPAKKHFESAIEIKKRLPGAPDSLLFKPLLHLGGIYYYENRFDTAFRVYKLAEAILDKYPNALEESERLFNRIGVMYYETGNYRLARNYFEKAIAIFEAGGNQDLSLLVNYKINIASLHIKLEEYDEANRLYRSVLPLGIYLNEIYHNLGIIELRLGRNEKALEYFSKVKYDNSKRNIDLYYNLAMVYSGIRVNDSVEYYLKKSMDENQRWNGNRKTISRGLILKLRANELVRRGSTREALSAFQDAIIQFDLSFNNLDIFSNPGSYNGIFSYFNLFNTLTEKAEAFVKWYEESADSNHLRAALEAYRSAFLLAGYVERNFESDEARLFLNRFKHSIHDRPIGISLDLFELTKDKVYLEHAYHFDQQNKASALVLNIQEAQFRNLLPSVSNQFEIETRVKAEIARFSLRSSQASDSLELKNITDALRDKEIELARIQERLIDDPQYRERHFSQYIPGVNELQKLLDHNSAIISYHLSESQLLALVITEKRLEGFRTPIDPVFYSRLDSLKSSLHQVPPLSTTTTEISQQLYELLIRPLLTALESKDRLIIIPDDDLHYLPFEVLMNKGRRYLVEDFSIQYQYSTPLLLLTGKSKKLENHLAFAPFISSSFSDNTGNSFSRLPASAEEIKNIKGLVLRDNEASKKNFVDQAVHSGIIHLATHASVNNEEPMRSYIVFSPSDSMDYRLYAGEIYAMDLDSADLVILSACETGTGKLVKGEGLMSLSRAFAYAGCSNIITSLWKAEDKTTAYLGNRLHVYLEQGFTKDRALQRAKLDLLNDKDLDPRLKAPNYWAHLLFIGNYEKQEKSSLWYWMLGGLFIVLAAAYFIKKRLTS